MSQRANEGVPYAVAATNTVPRVPSLENSISLLQGLMPGWYLGETQPRDT
jgi:hypothetical protein